MISHPVYILAILILIETLVLGLAWNSKTQRFFKYLPSMFWIYFLPMLAGTAGLLPADSIVYSLITKYSPPASLILLLLSVDVKAILKLGPVALAMMTFSVIGVMTGACAVMAIYSKWLPPDTWKGIGSLSASWIGGSANMIAVKEALSTPDSIFLPMVIVDTIVPYTWMGLLIAAAAYEARFDKLLCAKRDLLDDLTARAQIRPFTNITHLGKTNIFIIIALLTIIFTAASTLISAKLPVVKNMITPTAWAIVIATILGIALSFTPARNLESVGVSKIGFTLLYFVLTSIGAKANLSHIAQAPMLLLVGFTWIAIHALILIIATRILRAPLALAASASQACIGGPASAPVVASVYHPQLAPVGLLLAILGNITGTFLGLCVSQLCRMISGG